MCEVTPYMVSVATKRGISVIYTTVCRGLLVMYHSAARLISTTGVVYIYTRLLSHFITLESDTLADISLTFQSKAPLVLAVGMSQLCLA